MMRYVIYRQPDGQLDCIPEDSPLMAKATDIVEIVEGTCITAWNRLRMIEKKDKENGLSSKNNRVHAGVNPDRRGHGSGGGNRRIRGGRTDNGGYNGQLSFGIE